MSIKKEELINLVEYFIPEADSGTLERIVNNIQKHSGASIISIIRKETLKNAIH